MARTIFERYGGFRKISRVVISFYDKMTTSPITKKYFENINMKRLIDHQTKFIAYLMGGPASFSDEHLERVHRHMDIDRRAFDEMVTLLTETLEDFDFDAADIAAVRNELELRAPLILKKS